MPKTELAEVLGYTPQLIGQIEAGKNIPSKGFAEDLDTYFTTNGLFLRLWKLITETRHHAILPPGFAEFVAHEARASRIYAFEPCVIKGIFQTRDYAYELLKAGRGPEQIEELVGKRVERQEILTRPNPPRVVAVLDEMAVRRSIGGPEVMRGQIERLIELAEQPHITLQIVRADKGAYAGLPGAFDILGFNDSPDMVYIEGHVRGQLITVGSVVREYVLRHDLIRAAAMSDDESLKLLHSILESR